MNRNKMHKHVHPIYLIGKGRLEPPYFEITYHNALKDASKLMNKFFDNWGDDKGGSAKTMSDNYISLYYIPTRDFYTFRFSEEPKEKIVRNTLGDSADVGFKRKITDKTALT